MERIDSQDLDLEQKIADARREAEADISKYKETLTKADFAQNPKEEKKEDKEEEEKPIMRNVIDVERSGGQQRSLEDQTHHGSRRVCPAVRCYHGFFERCNLTSLTFFLKLSFFPCFEHVDITI